MLIYSTFNGMRLVLLQFVVFCVHTLAQLSCSGCQDPVKAFVVWTDNSSIWRCEKMNRIFMDSCKDTVDVYCNRKEDLGGSIYLMTFPESPENIGIKPDHVRKSKGNSANCVNGQWKIRNRNRTQTHLLCDQFLTEENRPRNFTSKMNEISTQSPLYNITNVATTLSSTTKKGITVIPYDFADLIYPVVRRRRLKGVKTIKKKLRRMKNKQKQHRVPLRNANRKRIKHSEKLC